MERRKLEPIKRKGSVVATTDRIGLTLPGIELPLPRSKDGEILLDEVIRRGKEIKREMDIQREIEIQRAKEKLAES